MPTSKKTSQETSGSPAVLTDLLRIARTTPSPDNFKLTLDEILTLYKGTANEWTKTQNFDATTTSDLGSELTTNGTFTTDTSWTKGAGWTISAGKANASSASSDLSQDITVTNGLTYEVTYTISNYSTGNVTPVVAGTSGTARSANGTYAEVITAGAGTSPRLLFTGASSFSGSIDNVIVKLANISIDAAANQVTHITLNGNRTINTPTNLKDGAYYTFVLTQDGTGSRTVTWSANFIFKDATAPGLHTAVGGVDVLEFFSDGTYLYHTGGKTLGGLPTKNLRVTGNTSTAYSLSSANGQFFDLTLNGNCTITTTAPGVTSAEAQIVYAKITQDGTGGRSLAWSGVTWLTGVAPTMPQAISAYIMVKFYMSSGAIYGDVVNANVVLGQPNVFTAQQSILPVSLTSTSASIAWNVLNAQNVHHTATENTTLANPTNLVAGTVYTFRWKQHASAAKTLAFGSAFRPAADMPLVSTVVNAVDIFVFYCPDGAVLEMIGCAQNIGT